jgi:hypothetical protein
MPLRPFDDDAAVELTGFVDDVLVGVDEDGGEPGEPLRVAISRSILRAASA